MAFMQNGVNGSLFFLPRCNTLNHNFSDLFSVPCPLVLVRFGKIAQHQDLIRSRARCYSREPCCKRLNVGIKETHLACRPKTTRISWQQVRGEASMKFLKEAVIPSERSFK